MICLCAAVGFGQNRDKIFEKEGLRKNAANSNRNKSQPAKYKIKQVIYPYKIGETTVKIVFSKTSPKTPDFLYFNMHDDENTAVEAALEVIGRFGGTLVELHNEIGERLIKYSFEKSLSSFDPNRIFTAAGIVKTLKTNGANSEKAEKVTNKFAEKLESYLKDVKLIIAVHNNTDENYSIKSYAQGGEFERDAKRVNINIATDIDDFFFVTEDKFYKILKAKNQNVALQDNAKVTDDGSLAVYCARNKIPYINVESEHGHFTEQAKMLEILQSLIKNFIRVKQKNTRR